VEYNTSTNQHTGTDPTFGGVVRDTSGGGMTGCITAGPGRGTPPGGYNATEKAFEFASSMTPEQHIQTPKLKNPSGNWVFSVSCWFKANSLHTGGVWQTNPGGTDSAAGVQVRPDGTVRIFVWGTTIGDFAGGYTPGEWVHVVALFKGVDQKGELFINGSSKVLTNNNSPLNLSGDNRIYIGSQANTDASVTSPFDGFISQFKLYDTVLTAEEAKTLYDMGRNGSVANPQPLHIAAPLYAPGTIVQVESSTKTDVTTIGSTTGENITGLSINIHPKFSTSKILVSYCLNIGGQGHNFVKVKRTQGGTTSYIGLGDVSGASVATTSYFYRESSTNQRKGMETYSFEFLDSANGTSAITYDIMCWKKASVYTMHINKADFEDNLAYYGRTSSSITAKEVCQ